MLAVVWWVLRRYVDGWWADESVKVGKSLVMREKRRDL